MQREASFQVWTLNKMVGRNKEVDLHKSISNERTLNKQVDLQKSNNNERISIGRLEKIKNIINWHGRLFRTPVTSSPSPHPNIPACVVLIRP